MIKLQVDHGHLTDVQIAELLNSCTVAHGNTMKRQDQQLRRSAKEADIRKNIDASTHNDKGNRLRGSLRNPS